MFDSGSRTAVNEAGRAHTSASIRPRSCPSMSGTPARPPATSDELEIGQQPTPGKEFDHHCDRVGSEADIGRQIDIRGSRVGEGLVVASREVIDQRNLAAAGGRRHTPGPSTTRGPPGARERAGSGGCRPERSSSSAEPIGTPPASGSSSVSWTVRPRAGPPPRSLQCPLRPVADRPDRGQRVGLGPTRRTPSASWR